MIADDVGGGTALQTGESLDFSFVLGFAGFIVRLADVSSLSFVWVSSELNIGCKVASYRAEACTRRIRFNLVNLNDVASLDELLCANWKDVLRAEDLIVKPGLFKGDGKEYPL